MTDQLPQWMKDLAPRLSEIDPGFLGSLGGLMGVANRPDDALDGRIRILVAMALDLASGSAEGTRSMSGAARGFGVTDPQIADVVKVCCAMVALQRVGVCSAAFGAPASPSIDALDEFASRLNESDPAFRAVAASVVESAFGESSDAGLALKDRLLVALALDAAFGSAAGVEACASRCRKEGATDAEILSVVKMAFVNGTLLRLATGRAAFPS